MCVYTNLLSFFNSANADDDDFVTPLKCYHLSNTVRGTRMIDISEKEARVMRETAFRALL